MYVKPTDQAITAGHHLLFNVTLAPGTSVRVEPLKLYVAQDATTKFLVVLLTKAFHLVLFNAQVVVINKLSSKVPGFVFVQALIKTDQINTILNEIDIDNKIFQI